MAACLRLVCTVEGAVPARPGLSAVVRRLDTCRGVAIDQTFGRTAEKYYVERRVRRLGVSLALASSSEIRYYIVVLVPSTVISSDHRA